MMTGKLDQISGEVKEKAGEVLDDSKLKAEGVVQQGVGKTKEVASHHLFLLSFMLIRVITISQKILGCNLKSVSILKT